MKEWYLLTSDTRPNLIGGYENESFTDYKEDAFLEALTTDIATTVLLYNSTLTEHTEFRCIIQENVASTQLKSMERIILAPIGSIKAGMYVYFENCYWLISGYPGNNGIYEKATLILCQYTLKWQRDDGQIIERPANITSAAKYDTGTSGNNVIILASNNFTIWIPDDDDSATLEDKRVFIDRSTTNPQKVFKITRSDDVLYLYGENHGGILSFIADRDELIPNKDRPDLGLCDYFEITENDDPSDEESTYIKANILGDSTIRCNRLSTWMVTFTDENDVSINCDTYNWNVDGSMNISSSISGNRIMLMVADESFIGDSFLLQINVNGDVLAEKTIKILEEL